MRRAFIAAGIAIFLLYCWASVAYQNEVAVPDYRLEKVDILGGKTRQQWDADTQGQFQRLMELEAKKYQFPDGVKIPGSKKKGISSQEGVTDADGNISTAHPLTSDDFAHIISLAPAGAGVAMELRNTDAIYALTSHNYLLRDPVAMPDAEPDAPPLFNYAEPVDKAMVDGLLLNGVKVITITGHGVPVSVELGTALMISVIFLTLAAALKPILWGPFMAMLEKRRHELEVGAEAERQNQAEEIRYADEKKARHAKLGREIQDLRMKGQAETTRAAGAIVKAAREVEKKEKLDGLRQLADAARETGGRLETDVPALAEEIAGALTPGKSAPRWEGLKASEKDSGD